MIRTVKPVDREKNRRISIKSFIRHHSGIGNLGTGTAGTERLANLRASGPVAVARVAVTVVVICPSHFEYD
jgi:hypothetical protein